MSDVILERLATATEGILAHLQKSPVFGLPTGGATAPKTAPTPANAGGATGGDAAAKKAAAAKVASDKANAEKAAAEKAAAAAKAGAGKKAPGGKHTIEQVRDMIRKVAADVDKQSAKDILADDGGGVEKVLDLKPEFYDKVFEACEVLLKGEGTPAAAAAAEDDDFAA